MMDGGGEESGGNGEDVRSETGQMGAEAEVQPAAAVGEEAAGKVGKELCSRMSGESASQLVASPEGRGEGAGSVQGSELPVPPPAPAKMGMPATMPNAALNQREMPFQMPPSQLPAAQPQPCAAVLPSTNDSDSEMDATQICQMRKRHNESQMKRSSKRNKEKTISK